MRSRLDLDDLLKTLCEHVYYQPPESKKLEYPCIIYSRDKLESQSADNQPYLTYCAYNMKYITKDPDDPLVVRLAELPKCKHGRHYTSNNFHHDSYTIYY